MAPEDEGEELVESVRVAVDRWVNAEDTDISREDSRIVANEEELVENISIMVAIALDKFS